VTAEQGSSSLHIDSGTVSGAGVNWPPAQSPHDVELVFAHLGVGRDERETVDLGLGHQQAIEGVAVVDRQGAGPIAVAGGDQRASPALGEIV